MSLSRKKLTKEQALQKLKHFCGYQERCHAEVRGKLAALGFPKNESGELLAALIEEDYLNEERFAAAFARGKFYMKQWGRIRIRYELAQKGISEYCLGKAMLEIKEADYLDALTQQVHKKWESLITENNPLSRKQKCFDFLKQKGYEIPLIQSALSGLKV